jgi:glycosyltransferase involved in cell wall biosynthesis
MKHLTIVMPYLNEKDEPKNTIESIYQTVNPEDIEIIVIDDHSNEPSPIPTRKEIRFVKNNQRIGVDGSRQIGIDMAKTPNIFIIDAHMRFSPNWFETLMDCITREPNTAWCTSCMQLGYGNMDLSKSTSEYTGASLLLFNKDTEPGRPAREILEPKWLPKKNEMEYEIPCILGANYFFTKKWLNYIDGLRGLKMWGTSEPFLSLKTLMAGGKCKITRKIKVGHKFRDTAPYSTNVWSMVYNKIYLCRTILPEDVGEKLINLMPKNSSFGIAMSEIEKNKEAILKQRAYYQGIFNTSFESICQKFSMQMP